MSRTAMEPQATPLTQPLTRREARESREREERRAHRAENRGSLRRPNSTISAATQPDSAEPALTQPVSIHPAPSHPASTRASTLSGSTHPVSGRSSSRRAASVGSRSTRSASTRSASSGPARRSEKVRVAKVRAAKSPTRSFRQRAASQLLSFGALLFAAALLVGLSVPASAFFVNVPTAVTAADSPAEAKGQSISASELAVDSAPVQRDGWEVTSPAELYQLAYGKRDYSYTVNNDGAVKWPFPVAVPISDGFGDRVSPCSGCSSEHKGTDFLPGNGSPISAVADGVVSVKEASSWGFGNHVFIDHVIDGQKVTTVYAHMQLGSSSLKVGDAVKAGDFVGLVGTTGASTGPHLHLEVRLDGAQVDPFAWLKANTGA